MRTVGRGSSEPREPSVSIPLDEAFLPISPQLRPRNRAVFVPTPVSSMKTSLSGSSSAWFSNQASRRLRTSGRCCSAGCVRRFLTDAVAVEEAPERADPETRAPPGKTPLQFGERNVLVIPTVFMMKAQ